MIETISNGLIKLSVNDEGGEMMSIIFNGAEYLWQGTPPYWHNRAINLFPINGRLKDGEYSYAGKIYKMGIHGFVWRSTLNCVQKTDTKIVYRLIANASTKFEYPFDFVYEVAYELISNKIEITYTVKNIGQESLYFCLGGHPGFNVPLDDKGSFESYSIVFDANRKPKKICFDKNLLITGKSEEFTLQNGILPLSHRLFDEDAIFLKDMGDSVTLKSSLTERSITICYKDMKYLGLWHTPKTDAPFLCIEPWSALPSFGDREEVLTAKSDITKLDVNQTYTNRWSITIT